MKMNMQNIDPQKLRDSYIRVLDVAKNSTQKARELANDLFALDLTVYSKTFSFDSIMFNSFAQSQLDETIAMHPEQIEIINQIVQNEALIVSAPTSFGKTFCVFEYIARYEPQNIVLIVPTLALVDEYLKKIIKKYRLQFAKYKIHTNLNEEIIYDFEKHNIFILTHDRVVQETSYNLIKSIDFLVIDEVYKLEKDPYNDRVLVLNMAYYHLAQKAKKYILLAPFIKKIEDINELEKRPILYNSNYSPVVNDVKIIEIINENDRNLECSRILQSLDYKDKTLIYFPTVTGIYKYINEIIEKEPILDVLEDNIKLFIEWAKDEIHDEWCLVKALERGYLIHNGQIPIGTRLFQMDFYESSEIYNRMLCTSTLLEGVNTTAKNIIITKPTRTSPRSENHSDFSAFDFFNLVGRTGRLYKHLIGVAYYIKGQNDPEYKKIDAVKSIRFELTDDSKDIDIQKGDIDRHADVIDFLKKLNITWEEYVQRIGSRTRFDTVKAIYERYIHNKDTLLTELQKLLDNPQHGRLNLVKNLYSIVENNANGFRANIINSLLNRNRPKIKSVVDNTIQFFPKINVDYIITTAISLKMSYIEHDFYTKVSLVRFFMEKELINESLLKTLDDKVIGAIEQLYFSSSKHKKMLLDLGIYERDIDKIVKIIGDDFDDAIELKHRLGDKYDKLSGISFISRYIIKNLIAY